MKLTNKHLIGACLLTAVIVFFMARCVAPQPSPQPERPVVAWLASVARTLLWVAFFGDYTEEPSEPQTVKSSVGEDGYPLVDHRRSL